MKVLTFFLTVVSFLLICSCNKKSDYCEFTGPHLFELPVSIYPAKEVYQIGDTIMINSVFGSELYDRKTKEVHDLSDFYFSPMTYVYDLQDTNFETSHNMKEFVDVIVEDKYSYTFFDFSDGNSILHGNYSLENGMYKLKYALVPKQAGLFLFKHGSGLLSSDHDQSFAGQCGNKGVEFATVVNGDTSNNNIHLLLESPDEHWNTWELEKPQERFHNQGGYAFRVIE